MRHRSVLSGLSRPRLACTLLGASVLLSCTAGYDGPDEAEVQQAVKASLERFDKPEPNRLAPHLAKLTQSDFAERLGRVRFVDDKQCEPREDSKEESENEPAEGTIYECPVLISMRMKRGAISQATGLPDTTFKGRLPVVKRDGAWALTDDSLAREMIMANIFHQSGVDDPFR